MSNFGPPQIFPPVPINLPGAPGSSAAPTLERGVYQNFFTGSPSKFSYASPTKNPIGLPTVFVPPVTFQQ